MKQFTKRLTPGQDLKGEIEKIVQEKSIRAGCILSIAGSLKKATLRLADGKKVQSWSKQFEIISGTGTVSKNGCHIHISLADAKGQVIGGHLKEGCTINTTAEIVLIIFNKVEYKRRFDNQTGYEELEVIYTQ